MRATRAAIVTAAAASLVALALGNGLAGGKTVAPLTATAKGVGDLRLGRTIDALREEGLIGGAERGCELAQGERVAPLRGSLQGVAHFYPGRRLSSIAINEGARTAAGIGIASTLAAARKAYPHAPYDKPSSVRPFPVGFIWIGGRTDPRMTLVIEPASHRVAEIAIPTPSFCE
jgi:hypothetical protein